MHESDERGASVLNHAQHHLQDMGCDSVEHAQAKWDAILILDRLRRNIESGHKCVICERRTDARMCVRCALISSRIQGCGE
jgi:hypothetical protein